MRGYFLMLAVLVLGYSVPPELSTPNVLTRNEDEIPNVALIFEIGADSANYLGFRYYNGEGVKQNIDSALYWIRKAAEAGDVKGAGNLGYLLSMAPEIEHDYPEAIKWLTKAADAGLPTAQSLLADLLAKGLANNPDTLKAIELYEKSAMNGLSDSQYRLIAMMGHKWQELPGDSVVDLGLQYRKKRLFGVAAELFMDAAEKNNPKGMTLIGDALSRGEGVSYNSKLAMEYFLKAALLGEPSAAFILAEFLEFYPDALDNENFREILSKKNGVEVTPQFLYGKAAEGGVRDADTAYRKLYGDK